MMNKWTPIAEQRKDRDGSFVWTPLPSCPHFDDKKPLVQVRKMVDAGKLLMATRKIKDWHYELVVKKPG